jgi:hypothetical protein
MKCPWKNKNARLRDVQQSTEVGEKVSIEQAVAVRFYKPTRISFIRSGAPSPESNVRPCVARTPGAEK